MKRRNVQLAFVGEAITEGMNTEEQTDDLMKGDEAVDFAVTSGKIIVVVPAGTPDEAIFDKASNLGGDLILENGLRLSFEIKGEAVGAQFLATHEHLQEQDHQGLSSIPNVPGGA